MSSSPLESAELLPPNALFDLVRQFKEDPNPDKLSLVIGAYRDAELEPYVFDVVRQVRDHCMAMTGM